MRDVKDSWPERCRRFRNRHPEDRKLILRAAVLLPLTRMGLRVFGFQRWKELLGWLVTPLVSSVSLSCPIPGDLPPDGSRSVKSERVLRAQRSVRSAELHGMIQPNCLERSMTLWCLLLREGIPSELHIGGRKNEAKLEAHAWVECDGKILNDRSDVDDRYTRFDAPIAAGSSLGVGGNAVK